MPKRKRATAADAITEDTSIPPIPITNGTSKRGSKQKLSTNPDANHDVIDGPNALRASPDNNVNEHIAPASVDGELNGESSSLQKAAGPARKKQRAKQADIKTEEQDNNDVAVSTTKPAKQNDEMHDPEADDGGLEQEDSEAIKLALSRPPPVNSDYLPLPWKGRLGYACLCTYLRYSNPPIFCSRTTRIASILEHRHPLKDPSQPEHATKNRPDKDQPADVRRGQEFVERLCLANVRDMGKLMRWNDKYGIKFLRLSSEAFPFASHAEYGYKLAPFASEALAEVGKIAAELGHRLTTHPGQFTQLGSPREQVIVSSIRDLEYHDEMLSLLKLPPQQDRDAIMVLHMGGVFGDKAATLDRFRENYKKLPPGVKERLVLENDDVCWHVHDLLPVCKELNIPFVLDFHHHNILFDETRIREGTKDIMELFPEIIETWRRKNKTPKMHYSEATPEAITARQRRKHRPRVVTMPPCPPDMDLMIEAKDKEQAVLELMRTFKLPGWDTFNDIIPYVRNDDNKPEPTRKKATPKKKGKKTLATEDENGEIEDVNSDAAAVKAVIPDDEIGMGGPEGRVYWPPGMEEWLRPKKRVVKKKEPGEGADTNEEKLTPAQKRAANLEKAQARKKAAEAAAEVQKAVKAEDMLNGTSKGAAAKAKAAPKKAASTAPKKKKSTPLKREPTPISSEEEEDVGDDAEVGPSDDESPEPPSKKPKKMPALGRRASSRAKTSSAVNYSLSGDEDASEDME